MFPDNEDISNLLIFFLQMTSMTTKNDKGKTITSSVPISAAFTIFVRYQSGIYTNWKNITIRYSILMGPSAGITTPVRMLSYLGKCNVRTHI